MQRDAVSRLQRARIRSAESEVRLLLGACLGLSRSELILRHDQEIGPGDRKRFARMLRRRLAREPIDYIIGTREFWSLDFEVGPQVLIPRPETEFLLETLVSGVPSAERQARGTALDLCTGSGVIAVVLARELPRLKVVAVDSSPAALAVARRNIERHGVADRIDLVAADLFSALRTTAGKAPFRFIVSNPPYVATAVLDTLQPEVRDYEPRQALDGGAHGLEIIFRIIAGAGEFLQPRGVLFMEIGADQRRQVLDRFGAGRERRMFEKVDVIADLAGRPRVLRAQKKP